MSQLDWDAYRYVLDDPSLDRAAFEARMLDDVELALAVAQAVAHVDQLRAASFSAAPVSSVATPAVASTRSSASGPAGWRLSSLAALAAGLLLAIGLLNFVLDQRPGASAVALSGTGQSQVVEHWLALQRAELVDVSTNLVDMSINFDVGPDDMIVPDSADAVATESSTDSDWLMDAAREFYSQGEAG